MKTGSWKKGTISNTMTYIIAIAILLGLVLILVSIWGREVGGALSPIAEALIGKSKEFISGIMPKVF